MKINGRPKVDIQGMRFGRLTAICRTDRKTSNGNYIWLFRCDCGKELEINGSSVRLGLTVSCGCYQKEVATQLRMKHGDNNFNSRLHRIWGSMKSRCNVASRREYRYYGGRGIKVCDEWNDYVAFKQWALTHGYADNLTIDRIDNDGNYEPSNCRWVTQKEQTNHTRRNRMLTFNGKTQNVTQWGAELGIKPHTIDTRLRKGWSVERSLMSPLDGRGSYERRVI